MNRAQHPRWREMNDILKRMLEILIRHESMRENAELEVSEPPIKNDQVFVMWYNLALIIARMHDFPPQLQASPDWNPEFEKFWRDEMLGKAKWAARWLSRDGRHDPSVRVLKDNLCPYYAREDPDFGDEINHLASMLQNITG